MQLSIPASRYTSLALRGVGVVDDILEGLTQMVAARAVASTSASTGTRAVVWAGRS